MVTRKFAERQFSVGCGGSGRREGSSSEWGGGVFIVRNQRPINSYTNWDVCTGREIREYLIRKLCAGNGSKTSRGEEGALHLRQTQRIG